MAVHSDLNDPLTRCMQVNPAWWGAVLAFPAAATLKAVVGRGGKPKQDQDGMMTR